MAQGVKHNPEDFIGMKFGKLTVTGGAERCLYSNGKTYAQVKCECSCGGEKVARLDRLLDGNVTTCGCGKKGEIRGWPKGSNLPEYKIWIGMKSRCGRKNHPALYDAYIKRGIKVCPEWEADFLAFYNHIGPRPTAQHTVDRIDNDRGYEPGNVRWATMKEQAANRRWPRKRKGYKPEELNP